MTAAEGTWPKALVAYEQAVGRLRALDPPPGQLPANPLSWSYLAAVHGRGRRLANGSTAADTSRPMWSTCQHGSWYFLPWHRMYLMAFELAVQDVLHDPDWSLPYWYAVNPDDPSRGVLPPAFVDRQTAGNDLFTENRSRRMNLGGPLPDRTQNLLAALEAPPYSTDDGRTAFGGGERSTPSFGGGEVGLLEGPPHGMVHNQVGNDYDAAGQVVRAGWMGSFYTAGLDPIFWLHHANLDRMWQVWLEVDPAHVNPTGDTAWTDTTFSFPKVGGGRHTWSIGEVLDPAALGYAYESTAPPSALAPIPAVVAVGGGAEGSEFDVPEFDVPEFTVPEADVPQSVPPQTIGVTVDVAVTSPDPVVVELSEPADLRFDVAGNAGPEPDAAQPAPGRVYLRIEGLTATTAAADYDVYLNLPDGTPAAARPELRAGTISSFGVVEASQRGELHDGTGLTAVLDVTRVRDRLAQEGRWDPTALTVSFRPVVPEPMEGYEIPAAGEGRPADLRAGQLTVLVT
jgi:tyrosinase